MVSGMTAKLIFLQIRVVFAKKAGKYLLILQPSQPLSRFVNFREAGIGVFPEGEEFLVMLYGFGFSSITHQAHDEKWPHRLPSQVLPTSCHVGPVPFAWNQPDKSDITLDHNKMSQSDTVAALDSTDRRSSRLPCDSPRCRSSIWQRRFEHRVCDGLSDDICLDSQGFRARAGACQDQDGIAPGC